LTCQETQLTDKAPRTIHGDYGCIGVIGQYRLGFPFEDDKEVVGCIAGLKQELSDSRRFVSAKRGDL